MNSQTLAIACASGSFKCAFVHGVLSAFEDAGVRAAAYGATSASALPAAAAAAGMVRRLDADYWMRGVAIVAEPGCGMSDVMLRGIANYAPMIRPLLFADGAPRFMVAASAVVTDEAAELTQGERASRLGRQLLLDMARGSHEWVDVHLQPALFDTASESDEYRLTPENFDAVVYASTRMLHAWKVPASIDGSPYVDGSYTCSCPAVELAERGYNTVIAIATEPGVFYRDLFQDRPMPDSHNGTSIVHVQPDTDPKEMGVEFTRASEQGIADLYQHGVEKGREVVERNNLHLKRI
jgi:predicted acylesterase/phospholipase RssA